MAIRKRISVAKGIAEKLVKKGYVKKSKMALIVAKGNHAEIVIPPTRNYPKVIESIENVPTGGKTPLSSALYNLLLLAKREKIREKSLKVRAFLITDGKANVPLFGKRIKDEIIELASRLKKCDIELNVYDTRFAGDIGLSFIPILKDVANGRVYKV